MTTAKLYPSTVRNSRAALRLRGSVAMTAAALFGATLLPAGAALAATQPATVAAPSPSVPASLPGLPGISSQTTLIGALAPRASAHPCARPAPGSVIPQPTHIYSSGGALNVHLDYYEDMDDQGNPSFCFLDVNGNQAPILHGKPGDTFNIEVTNRVPPVNAGQFTPFGVPADNLLQAGVPSVPATKTTAAVAGNQCGEQYQFVSDPSSVNVHYHGFLVTPRCQSDNVAHTVIAAGDTFEYSFPIPTNEPPGLYWFHPHVHGSGEQSVQGGASGMLVIDGIEQFHPEVAGLPERVLVFRDKLIGGNAPAPNPFPNNIVPTWDASINYVPVEYTSTTTTPSYTPPGVIQMQSGQKEFWRVVNTGADAIMDFQVLYDGVPQPVSVVALDGVPVNVENGQNLLSSLLGLLLPATAAPVNKTTIQLAPGQRAEFVIAPPGASVKSAVIQTLNYDTGLVGDALPSRTLATITTQRTATGLPTMPTVNPLSLATWTQRFNGLFQAPSTVNRTLYFSEVLSNPLDPASPTNFYITVDGATPATYQPGIAPAITTKVGSVETWTIQNRSLEAHVFHIHQIHYLMLAVNGVALSPADMQLRDDYTIPGWKPPVDPVTSAPYDPATGTLFSAMTAAQQTAYLKKYPYPSFTAKFDFRDPTAAGDFVYHCHILAHEDNGMMALIRVLP